MENTERKVIRTQQEIYNLVKSFTRMDDFFGIKKQDLVFYLDYEHAKEFIKPEVTEEGWNSREGQDKLPIEEMKSYMPFAWDKANNCRGLSASRSLDHYAVWLWLIGEEDIPKTFASYEFYGKPQLIEVCKFLGLDHTQWDDGRRVNTDIEEEEDQEDE